MPIYEYRCTKCRKRFSVEQSISGHKRRPACPKCKSRAVERRGAGERRVLADRGPRAERVGASTKRSV